MRFAVNTIALIKCGYQRGARYVDVKKHRKILELLILFETYGFILYFTSLNLRYYRIYLRFNNISRHLNFEICFKEAYTPPVTFKRQTLKFLVGQYWLINNKGILQLISPKCYKEGYLIAKIY